MHCTEQMKRWEDRHTKREFAKTWPKVMRQGLFYLPNPGVLKDTFIHINTK